MLPASWETTRLTISDGNLEEAKILRQIFNACSYVEPWDETFAPTDIQSSEELIRKSLRGENAFRLQTIRNRPGEVIGYFHLRHGFPKPEVVWVSMAVIHPDHQRNGIGTEVFEGVIRELRRYFHLRHGFPKPEVVWVSMAVIHPDHQRNGIGTEVFEGVIRELRSLGNYQSTCT